MKILQVCPHYLPAGYFGGVLQSVHSLSRALIELGHDVRLVTTSMESPQRDLDIPISRPVPLDGVTVFYEPVRFVRYWGFSPALARQVWRQTAWADVVLAHFHFQFASLAARWACRLRRRPLVVFAHGSLNLHSIQARGRLRKLAYLRLVEGRFADAAAVAFQSDEERENSLRYRPSLVVPNGLFPEEFPFDHGRGSVEDRRGGWRGKLVFLYLGRITAGKGLELLLRAFDRLLRHGPESHLVLAGADERGYAKVLHREVERLGLNSAVTFTGFVTGKDKLALLKGADVFVLPSRSEGMSMALLEAMVMGLPVVVTDRVGLHRSISRLQCGLVVSFEEDSLFRALLQMAKDQERSRAGQRGRDLVVRNYDWRRIAAEFSTYLRELV